MEAITPSAQDSLAAAVQEGTPASNAPSGPGTPDLAAEGPAPTPDVVVELTRTDALDVTISAATADNLERLTAAEPALRLELARLGAEVEAIRMELRPEQGAERTSADRPEQRPEQRDGHSAQTTQSQDNARQGDRMMRQNEHQNERREAGQQGASRTLRLKASPDAAQALLAAAGRIDRYA